MKDKIGFSVSSFEQLPVDVLDFILLLCEQTETQALLTVSSKIFPVVAKKIWSTHTITHQFGNIQRDFRRKLFFQTSEHWPDPKVNPKLPYLDFITELTFHGETKPEFISLLKHVSNCKSLTTWWSPKMASALVDSAHVVPYLSRLRIQFLPEGCRLMGGTRVIEQILKNRAEHLVTVDFESAPFCLYGILSTVLSKTKITHFSSAAAPFIFEEKNDAILNGRSVLPLSESPFLKVLSISTHQFVVKANLEFFDWIHTSLCLTTLNLTIARLRFPQDNLDLTHAFFYFLRTFPTFSCIKQLNLNFHLPYSHMELIPISIVPSDRHNYNLESLAVHFLSSCTRSFYEALIGLLRFFSNLKYLRLYFNFDKYKNHLYQRRNPLKLNQFLCSLSSLNLVKLRMDLPNRVQRFILPVLKNMTSLREVDLRLDAGLLYKFIPQLKQVTRFIFRPFLHPNFRVFVNGHALHLLKGEDHQGVFFVFKNSQLELLQSTPLERISFQSTFE